MFYPERIKGIKAADRVLEIGPGNTPHWRADVYLDLKFPDDAVKNRQAGGTSDVKLVKPVVYYDGGKFPFNDKEFDYAICSHVVEHVANVEAFLSEMFRVAAKGYIEFPTAVYEYMNNYDEHVNFVKATPEGIVYMRKSDSQLAYFRKVQERLRDLAEAGLLRIDKAARPLLFEGFEWNSPFRCEKASGIDQLCCSKLEPVQRLEVSSSRRIIEIFKWICPHGILELCIRNKHVAIGFVRGLRPGGKG